MKRNKKFASVVLCITILASSLSMTAGAISQNHTMLETTEVEQQEILISDPKVNSLDVVKSFESFRTQNVTADENSTIKGMVTSLLIGKNQVENSYIPVQLGSMLSPVLPPEQAQDNAGQPMNDNLTFFTQKAELFGRMRQDAGIVITDEQLEYDYEPVQYAGNTAVVHVTEHYSFQINTIDVRSYADTDYMITLEKGTDGIWSIVEVQSNDWFDQDMNYTPFDVDAMLLNMDGPSTNADVSTFTDADIPQPMVTAPAGTVCTQDYVISANRVRHYAEMFWQDYNSGLFGNSNPNGGDCMNFASQCLAVGLGFSCDSSSVSNASAPCDSVGQHTWKPKASSFVSCNGFRSYLAENTAAEESGLRGTVVEQTNKAGSTVYKPGDVILVDNGSGTPFRHAAVVTNGGVASKALVSAHNNNRHDVTVSWMWNKSKSIMLCRADGYYTYSKCAGHTYTNLANGADGTDSICNRCGYSRLRIDTEMLAPLTKGATATITAKANLKCYRIACAVTTPSGKTSWFPAVTNTTTISNSYKFDEAGIYTIQVSARDINENLSGSVGKSITYQIKVG